MDCPVYLINLDRSVARLERVTRALSAAGISFERVAAIDRQEASEEAARAVYDTDANTRGYLAPLSEAEIACMHSHRKAWAHFLETSDAAAAVFLEDDVEPLTDGPGLRSFLSLLTRLPGTTLCKLNLTAGGRVAPDGGSHPHRCLVPPLTNAAQALDRGAAARLLEFTATFHEPVDVALQRWWEHGVKTFVARPPLFREMRGRGYESTIRERCDRPAEGRLLREIRRPLFKARRWFRAVEARVHENFAQVEPGLQTPLSGP